MAMDINNFIGPPCINKAFIKIDTNPRIPRLIDQMFTPIIGSDLYLNGYKQFDFLMFRGLGGSKVGGTCSQVDKGRMTPKSYSKTKDILPLDMVLCLDETELKAIERISQYVPDISFLEEAERVINTEYAQICTLGYSLLNPELARVPNIESLTTLDGRNLTGMTLDFSGSIEDVQDTISHLAGIVYGQTGIEDFAPNVLVLPSNAYKFFLSVIGANRESILKNFVKNSFGLDLVANPYLPDNKGYMYKKEYLLSACSKTIDSKERFEDFSYIMAFRGFAAGIASAFPENVLEFDITLPPPSVLLKNNAPENAPKKIEK